MPTWQNTIINGQTIIIIFELPTKNNYEKQKQFHYTFKMYLIFPDKKQKKHMKKIGFS